MGMGVGVGVGYVGIFKLTPSFTFTPKPPESSVLTPECLRRLLASGKVHEDLTPIFAIDEVDYNREYVSFFGPGFALPYNLPGSGPDEHRTAIGRMIALREPGRPGFNERLIQNQNRLKRRLRCALYRYKQHFEARIERKHYTESYPEWLFKPHANARSG